ncbi:hypothetical protein BV25DRAFT_1989473 [Artomyces pyxidatus]|uniref:Uncharacterized protein n=1 Tax=Artomyces pyxidatus TaxID=48021 RepID=A0ACB8T9I4_9AGAM|nr:hypothetical protein BV25DRAFT_1989473 [Artomyces pyxidatus]
MSQFTSPSVTQTSTIEDMASTNVLHVVQRIFSSTLKGVDSMLGQSQSVHAASSSGGVGTSDWSERLAKSLQLPSLDSGEGVPPEVLQLAIDFALGEQQSSEAEIRMCDELIVMLRSSLAMYEEKKKAAQSSLETSIHDLAALQSYILENDISFKSDKSEETAEDDQDGVGKEKGKAKAKAKGEEKGKGKGRATGIS